MGWGELEKFRPNFGKKNQFRFPSLLEPGSCFPWERAETEVTGREVFLARGLKSTERNRNAQGSSPVCQKLLFLWGWERGIDTSLARQPTPSPDVQTSALHPQAALRTWYLGQQPGRRALFERCFPIFAQRTIHCFYDLTSTLEGRFNYITWDRSLEAISC